MVDDKEFLSSKPTTAGTNGTIAVPAASTAKGANPKAQLHNPMQPNRSAPYRQPYPRRSHHQRQRWRPPSGRRICCCCCFWSILIILIVTLIASVAAVALYVLYHPRPPTFSVPSLRIHRLNLTSTADSSASHLSSLFNLTLITQNPNSHFTFNYDPFSISVLTTPDGIFLGNGTIPAFSSAEKNQTSFRAIVVSSTEARELDAEEVSGLKSDLKKQSGLDLKMVMDTKVEIRMGKLKTKKVGIRVSCDGFKGTVPKGKSPSKASTDKSDCKVDLRIKIWNWTF